MPGLITLTHTGPGTGSLSGSGSYTGSSGSSDSLTVAQVDAQLASSDVQISAGTAAFSDAAAYGFDYAGPPSTAGRQIAFFGDGATPFTFATSSVSAGSGVALSFTATATTFSLPAGVTLATSAGGAVPAFAAGAIALQGQGAANQPAVSLQGVVSTSGAVTITGLGGDIRQPATGGVSAGTLTAIADGAVALSGATNSIGAAQLSGTGVTLSDLGDLTLGATSASAGSVAVATNGRLTVAGAVTSTAASGGTAAVSLGGQGVTLTSAVTATGGALTLNSGGVGAITEAGGGVISADTLTVTAGGAVTLTQNGNAVTSASLSGAGVSFVNNAALTLTGAAMSGMGALSVDTIGHTLNTSGSLSTNGGSVTLSGSTVSLAGSVSTGLGTVTLTGGSGPVGQTAAGIITAGTLSATATGSALTLTAANQVGQASLSGAGVSFTDAAPLNLTGATSTGGGALTVTVLGSGALTTSGTVSATPATVGGTPGPVTLSANAIALGGSISAGGAAVTLTGGSGGVSQSSGAITAATLTASATGGPVALTGANAVTSATLSGAGVSFTNAAALNLTGAVSTGALTVSTGSQVLTLAGDVTQSGAGATSLTAGAISQTAGALTTGALSLSASGAVTLTRTGDDFTGAVTGSAASAAFYDKNTLTIGDFTTTTGALSVSAAGDITLSGALNTHSGLTISTPGAATLSGSLSGAGGLTQAGAGTLTIQGANSYTGGASITAGQVVAQNAGAFGSGGVTVATTLTFSGASGAASNPISGAGAVHVFGVGTGSALSFNGAVTNSGGFYIDDASRVVLASGFNPGASGHAVLSAAGATLVNLGSSYIAYDGITPTNTAGSAYVQNGDATHTGSSYRIEALDSAVIVNSTSATGAFSVDNYGLIEGDQYDGVTQHGSGALAVTNEAGAVIYGQNTSGGPNGYGVGSDGGGALTLVNKAGAVIVGGAHGVAGSDAGDRITNAGLIASGAYALSGGAVTTGGVAAVQLAAGGVLTNQAGGVVVGGTTGVAVAGTATAVISNAGVIGAGSYTAGAVAQGGFRAVDAGSGTVHLTNAAGGVLTSSAQAVNAQTLDATNLGAISSGAYNGDIHTLLVGGALTLLNAGSISSANTAAVYAGGTGAVVNAASGQISNGGAGHPGTYLGGGGSVDNYGSIGDGVQSGDAATTLTLRAGSTTGAVSLGSAADSVSVFTGTGSAASAVTQGYADAASGATGTVTLQTAGAHAAAAFSTLALGGGANTLNLRGAGDGAAAGAAGALSLSSLTATGGSVALEKLDAGAWTLSGNAASAGLTRIDAGNGTASGVLNFSGVSNLSAPIYVDGAQITAQTAGAFGTGVIHAVDPTIAFAAAGAYTNPIALESADPAHDGTVLQNTSGGVVSLFGAITQGTSGANNTNGQPIAADQTLTFSGGGRFALGLGPNSWTGVTTVNGGVMVQGTTASISGGSIVNNGALTYVNGSDGALAQTISGAGSVTFDNGATYTIAAGVADTYTGATTLAAGVLKLDGSLTSSITVGSSTRLQGTGSTTGAVTVSGPTATFAPGEGTGTFTAASLALTAPAVFSETIGAAGAFGRFTATSAAAGAVTLSGSLSLNYTGGAEAYGTAYVIVQDTGGGTVTGTFSNAAQGAILVSNGHAFEVSYSSAAVTLTDVTNVAPVLGGSGTAAGVTDQQTGTPLSALTVTDPDAGQTQTAVVSFAAANGAFAGLGAETVSSGVATYTVTGSAAAVQAALRAAVFTPSANQAPPGQTTLTTFTIHDTDSTGAAAATTATVTLDVTSANDAPATAGAHASNTDDRTAVALFSGVTVTDPDVGQTETAVISFTATDGALTGAGPASMSGGVASYTVTAASAAALTTALQAVTFQPTGAPVGPATTTTFTLAVSDGTASATDSSTTVTAAHTTNTVPVLGGGGGAAAVTDKATATPLSALTVTDPDAGQTQTVTVSFTAANGTFGGLGAATVTAGTASYTVTGQASAVQQALQAAVFTPTANQTAPGATVTTLFTISDVDSTGAAANPATASVAVASVNDVPTVAGAHASTTDDRNATVLFSGVTVADPDVGQTETATIRFTAADGVLTGAGAASVSAGVATYTLSAGSASALTAALDAVTFAPSASPVGPATVTTVALSISDGVAASATDVSTVVTSTHTTNTPPVLGGVPGSAATPVPAAGAEVLAPALTITDPDAGASVRGAQVAVTAGFVAGDQLTAGSLPAGLSASYDARTGVLTLTGAGSDADYQAALRTVFFSHSGAVEAGGRTVVFGVTDDAGAASIAASETLSVSAYSPPSPPSTVPTPSQQAGLGVQAANLDRAAPNDPALSDPASPLYAQAQAAQAVAAQLDAGRISAADAQAALFHLVDGTTSVAEIAYAFFTGKTPTAAGLDYLVHSAANPTDLNDPYYAKFSTENRYINFAANLGRFGDASTSAFHAAYDGLNLTDATAKAYQAIFGAAATADKVGAILNAQVSDGLGGTETRAQYFAYYGTDGLDGVGTKSAMIGWLLADSVKEGFGTYQQADQHFLADLAHGSAAFNVDLLSAYGAAPTLVGQPTADPALGS